MRFSLKIVSINCDLNLRLHADGNLSAFSSHGTCDLAV